MALVTAECIKGSATRDDGDYKIDFIFLLTIFIMLVFPLAIGLWHWCRRSTSFTPSTATTSEDAGEEAVTRTEAEVQTEFSWYDMKAPQDQYIQADIYLDHYKQEIEDLHCNGEPPE